MEYYEDSKTNKEKTNIISNAFINFDIEIIKESILQYAKEITKAILDEDCDKVEQLIEASNEIRDIVEINKEVPRTKEFYYGYLFAYENIASRIIDYEKDLKEIKDILNTSKEIENIFILLGEEKAISGKKHFAKNLNIGIEKLDNILNSDLFKKINILTIDNIGENTIYSLNARGRYLYKKLEALSN